MDVRGRGSHDGFRRKTRKESARMMDSVKSEPTPRSVRLLAVMTGLGLVAGALTGWATGKLLKSARVESLPWSDLAALVIALSLLGGGLLTAALSSDRRGLAILANPRAPEFTRAVTPSQALFFRLQAGVLILAGLLLATPVATEVMFKGRLSQIGPLALGGVVLGFALQTALNIALWRRCDEVYRQTIAETGAACFWILQGVLFLWASAEKLKVAPAISSWDAVTAMMAVYLLISVIVASRRGLEWG
jgi:uncharacterized membrane protein (Fun14 family)